MHFEILVEDQSGQKMLDILVPKIIGADHTCKVIAYKGVGRIPKNINAGVDASKRMLLNSLPRLLKGYGKSWANYPAAVFVVCDLDDKCLKTFLQELYAVLNACNPRPETRFCIAVDVANNASPSFVYLRQKLLALICRYRMSRKSGPTVRPA